MEARTRSLIIGLDGATFDWLTPFMDRGLMPTLRGVMQCGCYGALNSTMPPFTATAWSSVITGQNPGGHGILSFQKRDRFNYDVQGSGFANAGRFEDTLWEIFSSAEHRVGVVNVPMTFPARPINGEMITGMLTPPGSNKSTWPPTLASELETAYEIDVAFIHDGDDFRQQGFPTKAAMLAEIQCVTEARISQCLKLLQSNPYDFFMVVFTGTDRISHFLWDELMAFARNETGILQAELQDYFKMLDDGIAQILALVDENADIFVISDHGFGAAPKRRAYVNVWLEQLGVLKQRAKKGMGDLEYWRVRAGRNPLIKKLVRRFIPQATQMKVRKVAESSGGGEIIDWDATQAYFVPIYFHVGGIELNLKDARRQGIVTDEQYEAVRDHIIAASKNWVDEKMQRPIIRKIWRREELYSGVYVQGFPDLIVEFDPDYFGMTSMANRQLIVDAPPPNRSGEHRQDGVFVACGPSIGARGNVNGLDLLDVPATVLYAAGLGVPERFDSRVMEGVVSAEALRERPIIFYNRQTSSTATPDYSDDDEAALTARLRGLGYL